MNLNQIFVDAMQKHEGAVVEARVLYDKIPYITYELLMRVQYMNGESQKFVTSYTLSGDSMSQMPDGYAEKIIQHIVDGMMKELRSAVDIWLGKIGGDLANMQYVGTADSFQFEPTETSYLQELMAMNSLKSSKSTTQKFTFDLDAEYAPGGFVSGGILPKSAENVFASASKQLPGMDLPVDKCPGCWAVDGRVYGFDHDGYTLRHVIINLNDEHKWTREQIADWIESHFDEVPYFEGESDEQD